MRIIAGEHRGRALKVPPGEGTRPMLDRIREALFSSLGARVDGARVLDLFAGCGSLGLEALSRGADHARLVESDPRALRLLRENVQALRFEDRSELLAVDALGPSARSAGPYDLVFVDPPYALVDDPRGRQMLLETLEALLAGPEPIVPPEGMVVLHTRRGRLEEGDFGAGVAADCRNYGTNSVWYLNARPVAAEDGA